MADRNATGWRSALPSGTILAFLFVAGMIIALTAISLSNLKNISHNDALVLESHEIQRLLADVLAKLVDAETAQRGYIITGDERYLEPFQQALPLLDENLKALIKMVDQSGQSVADVEKLETDVASRISMLEEGIRQRREKGEEGGRAFILTGRGKREMDGIRAQVADLQSIQSENLKSRSRDSERSHAAASSTIFGATFVGLAVVGLACYLSLREVNSRQRVAAELEERVRQRTQELADTNEALQLSNRELEQFASVASHDLQEPLRKIEAFGDRLSTRCRDSLSEQGVEYLDRILTSASRMRTLINDLLSYARVASRAQPFTKVDCTRLVNEVVGDLESRITEVDGQVNYDSLPTIDADPTQLRQVFQNLISNALKFHQPEVPPRIEIAAEQVTAPSGTNMVRFSVRDNGIGFDEIYLDRIFEVFQRLHGRAEYEGTGIGLAICRKIIERHGGSITAQSQPGAGSTFLITLPAEQENGK